MITPSKFAELSKQEMLDEYTNIFESFDNSKILIGSYYALKEFVANTCEQISNVKIDIENEESDKVFSLVLKFSEKLEILNNSIDNIKNKLTPEQKSIVENSSNDAIRAIFLKNK